MTAQVFVEWSDHGVLRASFTVDYSPSDLEDWFKDDAELGDFVTEVEDDLGVYLESRFDDGGAGWLLSDGGGPEEAAEVLSRLRAYMQALGVPGA